MRAWNRIRRSNRIRAWNRILLGATISSVLLPTARFGTAGLQSPAVDRPLLEAGRVPTASPRVAATSPDVPAARAHHRLVSIPGSGVLLIGGSTRRERGYVWFDDAWMWRDGAWSRAGSLPWPRSSHAAAWDGAREGIVLLGGIGGAGDVAGGTLWVRSDDRWTAVMSVPGEGWAEPAACYDGRRRRVVFFGGWDRDRALRGDTWAWDGETLQRVADEGPVPRAGHEMAFDPVRGHCILFGGRGPDGLLGDTWQWDGEAWRRLAEEGPPPRWFFGMTTAEPWSRVVLFGGAVDDGSLGDTWAWDGTAWSRLDVPGPPARGMSRLAFDGERVVLFGGRRARGDRPFVDLNDTWLFDGSTWRLRAPETPRR